MPQLQLIVDKFMRQIVTQVADVPILAAVSGGVDSMVLMHLLERFCRQNSHHIAVVHVNHGLRETADRDEQIVRFACLKLGIPCYCRQLRDAIHNQSQEKGIEATARSLRYSALFAVAREIGTTYVVLAHHGEDQVETFLWRWLRGTSSSGLAGMRPVAKRNGFSLLRPLLTVEKRLLIEYAKKNQIVYGVDETNDDVHYTRNYLRRNVVPLLKRIQPEVNQVTERLTSILQEEDEFLNQMARNLIHTTVGYGNGIYRFSRAKWADTAIPLQRRAIHILLYCFASAQWSYSHIEAVLRLVSSLSPSAIVSLPGGISAWREYDVVCIGFRVPPSSGVQQDTWNLAEGSIFSFGHSETAGCWTFTCERWVRGQPVRTKTLYELHIPTYLCITIRTAETATRIQPLGLRGTKKLQDIFTDKKVQKSLRTSWPAIFVNEELIWLPGLVRAEFGKLDTYSELGWRIVAKPPDVLQ